MPKRFVKRRVVKKRRVTRPNARKVRGGGQRRGGRRLQTTSDILYGAANLAAPHLASYAYDYVKTRAKQKKRSIGRLGQAAVDAASGAVSGFVARMRGKGPSTKGRTSKVISSIASMMYPVIKDKLLSGSADIPQPDWSSGTQSVTQYNVGFDDTEVQSMLEQSNSAQTVATTSTVVPVLETLVNQRMDIYQKSTKFNIKNTCSRTVYIEIRAYECKGYHGFTPLQCWIQSLADDNMLQNSATYGTEETFSSPGLRPNMNRPQMNMRWKQVSGATYKMALEPGQETSYKYTQKGSRFDQQRFNISQGSTATPVDVLYMNRLSSVILMFCRSETVTGLTDTDVTYGSGHLAMNSEVMKSWSAVPYIKPYQTSYRNAWGTIAEADEQDINQNVVSNQNYFEQT